MNWPLVFDLIFELIYNFANSLSGYMLGAKVLGWPEPAAWLLALMFGMMGMVNHWRALRKVAVLLLVIPLTGCAAHMNPDQLREYVKIKDASVYCFTGTYAGAKVNGLAISADKGVPAGVQIDSECKASFMATPLQ